MHPCASKKANTLGVNQLYLKASLEDFSMFGIRILTSTNALAVVPLYESNGLGGNVRASAKNDRSRRIANLHMANPQLPT
jgi:hypothetical protein